MTSPIPSDTALEALLASAREAAVETASLDATSINATLNALADETERRIPELLSANAADLARMSPDDPKYDRLQLSEERIRSIASDLRKVATLPSPAGRILQETLRPNGLKLKKVVPQRVFAPRFKKPKNYSYFVFVENAAGQILTWKRASVVKNTTVKLPLCLKSVGAQELTIRVMCDSVVGIDESMSLNVKVTGSEEEAQQCESNTRSFQEYMDDEMDAEQFEDEIFDEYLADGF